MALDDRNTANGLPIFFPDIEGTFLDLSHNSSLRLINEIKPFLGHYNQKVCLRTIALFKISNFKLI